ncbi:MULTISPECIES: cutinase family protein [unclassified Corynebacterium]|uniref:cutinase family protein n=1 Tax=unclassified Corynebacterium TaxID=2624378 RepID=UPI0029CA3867|nr:MULTISPECIES: cutinase family protein [unclassified Corynebacterium]WPF66679.1 cutinase family protein [Corynebacterium sp. 22KM0430]WPF69166.1 cutinase family protein [Corynebacterium sp. 21KM1197]
MIDRYKDQIAMSLKKKYINKFMRFVLAACTATSMTSVGVAVAGESSSGSSLPVGGCASNLVFVVPGSANTASFFPETVPHGAGTTGIAYRLNATPGVSARMIPFNSAWPVGVVSYSDSYAMGLDKAMGIIAREAQACPSARISLFGYSEGADIAAGVVEAINAHRGPVGPERFGSAALMANPSRGFNGALAWGSASPGEALRPVKDYGVLAERVLEICNAGDVVCDTDHVAPTMNAMNTPVLQDSALLRGQVAWDKVVEWLGSAGPATLPAMVAETPGMLVGWAVHGSYLMPGDGLDAGESFLRAHFV